MRVAIRYKGSRHRSGTEYDAVGNMITVKQNVKAVNMLLDDRTVSIKPADANEARKLAYKLLSLAEKLG